MLFLNMGIATPCRWVTSSPKLSLEEPADIRILEEGIGSKIFVRWTPDWVLSNYFYREMSTLMRWLLLPFLLLTGVTVIAIFGEIFRILGIFDYNVLFHNPVMSRLPIVDNVLQVVIEINSMFLFFFGVPTALVVYDLMRTLRRFRLLTSHGVEPDVDSSESYLRGAQEAFRNDDKVAVFVFGHTHAAFLKRLGPSGKVVLNTGTWLKLLSRIPVRFGPRSTIPLTG